ncbi:uncharacterized protein LOC133397177 [Phycodurus eques]|uniref:uncharacterized protein LOC133397177 n=1 Tax=Phycodurus eques TaxID=693459 RepID=UPI002ACDECB8|nr:uncharacterized protein LOC133397177 [Phycodurus eques]XP_061523743.1 uncharacterized protein LOC133397177 [Phycodurus eques]XP_061523745.1 uncharacterized protein LOC133397177 [Phycodurus eques]XP_061523746.1 uncharacterized protein LOC133397177 [Phycodurus eques]
MSSSPTTLNFGQNKAQNLDCAGGADSAVCGQLVSSRQASTCGVLPTGEMEPPTDDQIQTLIADRLAYFRTQKNSLYGSTTIHKGLSFWTNNRDACSNQIVAEQFTAAAGKAKCLNGNTGKADGICPKFKDDFTDSASENLSSEYLQIMMDVATTCSKHQGGTDQNDSSKINNKPVCVGVSSKPELFQVAHTKSNCIDSVASNNEVKHFHGPADYAAQNLKTLQEKALSPVPKGKKEELSLAQFLKDPRYEDISDDDRDLKEPAVFPLREQKNRFQAYLENPQYEDISDDETSPPTLELPPPTEPKGKISLLKNKVCRQDLTEVQTEIISDEEEGERQMHQSVLSQKVQYEPSNEENDLLEKDPSKESKERDGPETGSESSSGLAASCFEAYDSSKRNLQEHFEADLGLTQTTEWDMADKQQYTFQKERLLDNEIEDSCDTEDSCDYPTGSARNYLTVSERLLKCSAPPYSEDEDSESGDRRWPKSSKPKKVGRMQKHANFMNVQPKANSLTDDLVVSNKVQILASSEDDNYVELNNEKIDTNKPVTVGRIIILDSDTEEKEQHCKASKRKRFSHGSTGQC